MLANYVLVRQLISMLHLEFSQVLLPAFIKHVVHTFDAAN